MTGSGLAANEIGDRCIKPADVADAPITYPVPAAISCAEKYTKNPRDDVCYLCDSCVPICNSTYTVNECTADNKRTITFSWVSSTLNGLACKVEGELDDDITLDCDY